MDAVELGYTLGPDGCTPVISAELVIVYCASVCVGVVCVLSLTPSPTPPPTHLSIQVDAQKDLYIKNYKDRELLGWYSVGVEPTPMDMEIHRFVCACVRVRVCVVCTRTGSCWDGTRWGSSPPQWTWKLIGVRACVCACGYARVRVCVCANARACACTCARTYGCVHNYTPYLCTTHPREMANHNESPYFLLMDPNPDAEAKDLPINLCVE